VRDVWTELGYDAQSGAISAEELSLGLARLGLPSSMLAVRQIFAEAGKDADDGVLEYAELLGYVRRREDEIMDSFARLTPRRTLARISTDAIAFADLKESLSRLGVQASDREIAVFLAQLDGQGSQRGGELGLHEFATFVYRLPRVDVAAAFESWLAARGGGLDTGAEPGQVHSSTVESTTASSEAVFLAGAVAGVISRTATAPLDRLKMLMQVGIKWAPQRPIGVVGGLRAIYAQGGFPAFFQGNTANVVKVMPESGVKFWAYDHAKMLLCVDPRHPRVFERLLAGACAGAASCVAIYPLEVPLMVPE
jgi:solute carrier family 25 (mitochondrial phosphate transporter), member 23/24/25/41